MSRFKNDVLGGRIFKISLVILTIAAFVFFIGRLPAKADDLFISDRIPAQRDRSFIATSTDGLLSFTAKAGTSTADLPFQLATLHSRDEIKNYFPVDDKLIPVSDLYSLTLSYNSPAAILSDFDPRIVFKYPNDSRLRNLYLWDPLSNAFIKLAAVKDLKASRLNFRVPDYGQFIFALFEEPELVGKSSWYVHPKYRNEMMAASTQFSRGAKVKVTNLDNNKSVIVTIKDWGPDPILHPDRVIDLNKVAFKKIASTWQGIINVKVEPYIAPTSTEIVKK